MGGDSLGRPQPLPRKGYEDETRKPFIVGFELFVGIVIVGALRTVECARMKRIYEPLVD